MENGEFCQIDNTEIIAIRNLINDVYLLKTDDGYILIDAGSDADTLLISFEQLSIKPSKVKYIFLTHTDYDHVASLNRYKNAKIYVGKKEKDLLTGITARDEKGGTSLPKGMDINSLNFLEGNEKFEIGGHSVECINAPGHTIGSMAYLIDDKYLFTGDAFEVFEKNTAIVHPFTMDSEKAKITIDKLSELFDKCELVLTGHFGYYDAHKIR